MDIIRFIYRLTSDSWIHYLRAFGFEIGYNLGFELGSSVGMDLGAPVGYPLED